MMIISTLSFLGNFVPNIFFNPYNTLPIFINPIKETFWKPVFSPFPTIPLSMLSILAVLGKQQVAFLRILCGALVKKLKEEWIDALATAI